jgi:hypothetical protein
LAPPFLAEPLGPFGLPERGFEVEEQHVKVVEAAEMLLEAAQRVRERPVPLGVYGGGQVRPLSQVSDADAQAVQTVHRRAFARPSMGRGHVLQFPGLMFREHPAKARPTDRAGSGSYRLRDMVEQERLTLRAEERAQKLSAGARIIPQASPVAVELVEFLPGSGVVRNPIEESERNIAVPHLSHEPGQATDATVEGPQRNAVGREEKLLPDAEAGPQPTHLAMQAMQARRSRVGVLDHLVDPSRDLSEDPVEFPGQPFEGGRPAPTFRRHAPSPNAPNLRSIVSDS